MRGRNLLEKDNAVPIKQGSRGRSKVLILQRNEILFNRYYFYNSINKISYECTINILSKEFYLSAIMVVKILTESIDKVRKIKHDKPSIAQLKRVYPHFNWCLKGNN